MQHNNEHMASLLEKSLMDRSLFSSCAALSDATRGKGEEELRGVQVAAAHLEPVVPLSPTAALPSVLMSILRQENIDYHNDFYWLTKVSSSSFYYILFYFVPAFNVNRVALNTSSILCCITYTQMLF